MRKKIALGIVAAAAAIPSLSAPAAAQGYYGGGYRSYSPADLNRDGRVDARENRIAAERQGNYRGGYGGYESFSPADLNRDGRVDRRENRIYRQQTRSGGYYGNSYGYNGGGYYPQQSYGGAYGRYYNQQGYYSGPTWRGNDGRYYCRRSDGTTGTLVGGAAGALIGSQVAGRGDGTIGAILGGAVGALIGNQIERGSDNRRCY